MKTLKLLTRTLNFISPHLAAKFALWLFQRTPQKKSRFRKREKAFYEKAHSFRVTHTREDLHCYEMGNPFGPLALLVHGWESNAGSMNEIAEMMSESGYHVVAIDLPGHGYSKLRSTNLMDCSEAIKSLLMRLKPNNDAVLITHSFGSAATAHALSRTYHEFSKWVILTTPNKTTDIFETYRDMIGLGEEAFILLKNKAAIILNEDIEWLTVNHRLNYVNCRELLIIHDKEDKVIPVEYSRLIHQNHPNTQLIEFNKIGHYRMLTNSQVLKFIKTFLSGEMVEYSSGPTPQLTRAN